LLATKTIKIKTAENKLIFIIPFFQLNRRLALENESITLDKESIELKTMIYKFIIQVNLSFCVIFHLLFSTLFRDLEYLSETAFLMGFK